MKILRQLSVPTGEILIVEGETKKPLELVSLGDYGKHVNIKADFLGLTRHIEHVKHQELLPLTQKWVITISTQYGCSIGCKFCDVPKVGPGINATFKDLMDQFYVGLSLHKEIKPEDCQRINVHFARMGEPSWNDCVLECAIILATTGLNIHPVVSTMMPRANKKLRDFLRKWCYLKNELYDGEAGLQLSINSTDNKERAEMFNNSSLDIEEVAEIAKSFPAPNKRKYTLNFALANYEIDAEKLATLFDPKMFICKLTPLHNTSAAKSNGLKTPGDATTFAPYAETEAKLKKVGFDVLVFIASHEEDAGLITCGNAILSGSLPTVPYKEII